MSRFVDNLKSQVEENPILAVGVGTAAVTALSSLLKATSQHRNSRAWKKEVNRRVKKSK